MSKISTKFKRKYIYFLLSLISGILIGTSYIPYPAWAVAFCYIPLWFSLVLANQNNENYKVQFFIAWTTQFILTLIGFNWIYYTSTEFGHIPSWLSVIVLLLFCSFMHIYIPISAVLASYLKKKYNLGWNKYFIIQAILLSLLERFWPSIFEWNLGYTLFWMKWPIFQWADTIGFLGLSSLIFIFQSVLMIIIFNFKKNKESMGALFIGLLALLVIFHTTGKAKYKKWSTTDIERHISVTQANISNEEKLASEMGGQFQGFVVRKYIDTVNGYIQKQKEKKADFKTDIIIWPETAVPIPLDSIYQHSPLQQEIKASIQNWGTHLITGGYSQNPKMRNSEGQVTVRNSVFIFDPSGSETAAYYKSQLLAFGEYIPFGDQFPILYKLLPFVGNFQRGPGPSGFKLSSQKITEALTIGPQICYESLDPGFSRELSKKSVDIIFNFTNDSWFGDWAEPYQHLYMTLARAVETRRPMVRSTNTGFSSAVLANGTELERSPMNQTWMTTYKINYLSQAPLSFYTQWGHYDWVLLILILILLVLIKPKNNLRTSHDNSIQ